MSNKRKARPAAPGPKPGGGVAVGWCYGVDVASGFANSLIGVVGYELVHGGNLRAFIPEQSGVNVSHGRNEIVRKFLDEGDCEWLLMLDADMTFDRFLVSDMVRLADAEKYPILGGLCFGVRDGVLFPTLYDAMHDTDGNPVTVNRLEYPEDDYVQVMGTGAACLMIHRSAAEAIRDKGFNRLYPWFQESELWGDRCGEDMTFCLRAWGADIPVHVHTGVKVGHQKAYVLTEDLYRQQRAIAAAVAAAESEEASA